MKQAYCPGCSMQVTVSDTAGPGYKFDCDN